VDTIHSAMSRIPLGFAKGSTRLLFKLTIKEKTAIKLITINDVYVSAGRDNMKSIILISLLIDIDYR
jgi:hypothetical protein